MRPDKQKPDNLKPQSVKLSGQLVKDAEIYGKIYNRSKPGQIEFWAKVGKITEENPDLPFNFIEQALLSQEEVKLGKTSPYQFGDAPDTKIVVLRPCGKINRASSFRMPLARRSPYVLLAISLTSQNASRVSMSPDTLLGITVSFPPSDAYL